MVKHSVTSDCKKRRHVLVTGGAGYIGSITAQMLMDIDHIVTIVDDLSTSDGSLLPAGARFVHGCAGDRPLLNDVMRRTQVDAVMHFAASISVEQSMAAPAAYYRNNLSVTIELAEMAAAAGVRAMVFSSTAAVYGEGDGTPLGEDRALAPINAYGRSKAMAEAALADIARASGNNGNSAMGLGILRYFNAAGADPQGRAGQATAHPHHLIEIATQVATGARAAIDIYGDDYPTPDGTAVRDYVHVSDIAAAHVLVMDRLLATPADQVFPAPQIFNIGTGRGASVLEVLDALARVSGTPIATRKAPRRPGDPAVLIADSRKVMAELGWQPRYRLDDIVAHALMWEQSRQANPRAGRNAGKRVMGLSS